VRRLKGSLKTIQPLIEHKVALLNERRGLESFVALMRPNQKVFPIGRTLRIRRILGMFTSVNADRPVRRLSPQYSRLPRIAVTRASGSVQGGI
jgi:hypothetical protein